MEASSQRASWWQVRLALMLVLGVAAAAACVAALMWWKAPGASAKQATSSNASFVVRCDFSHRKHDDPIVFPGERGAAHSHEFFGNRSTNYASTYKSLRAATATTCSNPADKAAYWMPTMKWGPRTLQPSYALLYYRAAHKAPQGGAAAPPGAEGAHQRKLARHLEVLSGQVGNIPAEALLQRNAGSAHPLPPTALMGSSTAPTTGRTWPTPSGKATAHGSAQPPTKTPSRL